jgi:hypothetical protein
MPRRSNKKKLLQHILVRTIIEITWANNIETVDRELNNCCEDVLSLLSFRYTSPRLLVPKSKEWFYKVLPEYDNLRFKSSLRVDREDFEKLLNIISPSPIFHTSKKMIAVDLQLAISLYRFGCEGSGVSYIKVGQMFGISDGGTIKTCTERVIKA